MSRSEAFKGNRKVRHECSWVMRLWIFTTEGSCRCRGGIGFLFRSECDGLGFAFAELTTWIIGQAEYADRFVYLSSDRKVNEA